MSHAGDENKYGSQIVKKYTANSLARRGRPLTSQTAFGGQLPYKGSLVQPVVRFGHTYSCMMVGFYELRITNNEPRLFFGLKCGVPPRQIHEMNAVRRRQFAGRKKYGLGGRIVGASCRKPAREIRPQPIRV